MFKAEIKYGGKNPSEKMQHDKRTLLNKATGGRNGLRI